MKPKLFLVGEDQSLRELHQQLVKVTLEIFRHTKT